MNLNETMPDLYPTIESGQLDRALLARTISSILNEKDIEESETIKHIVNANIKIEVIPDLKGISYSPDGFPTVHIYYFTLGSRHNSQKLWLEERIKTALSYPVDTSSIEMRTSQTLPDDVGRNNLIQLYRDITGRDPLPDELLHPCVGAVAMFKYWYINNTDIRRFVEYRALASCILELINVVERSNRYL